MGTEIEKLKTKRTIMHLSGRREKRKRKTEMTTDDDPTTITHHTVLKRIPKRR
jgi:hypothetical protein